MPISFVKPSRAAVEFRHERSFGTKAGRSRMAAFGAKRSFARNQYFATRKEGKLSRPDGTMSYVPLTASVSKLAGAFAIPQPDVGASSLGFPCRCEPTRG